jgi:glucose/arabinose dehydrogenase
MFLNQVKKRKVTLIVILLLAASLLLVAGVGYAGTAESPSQAHHVQIIELEPLASGLAAPLGVTHAGDGSGRAFIVDQVGQIRIVQEGELLATPFLDVSAKLPQLHPFFDERGLLGLAFHPDYADNGRFFIRYSSPRDGAAGEPCFGTSRGCHTEILAEYAVAASDPNQADPNSEVILYSIDQPQFNHNAGDIAFGPDGFLYFTLGDGGGAHDGLADMPPSHGPIGNAQNIETTLGAILRINVDRLTICHDGRTIQVAAAAVPAHLEQHDDTIGSCSGEQPTYAIPPTNPFVQSPGADEIYAYGMRNPYRFSFDDGPGGNSALFLADVGQNLFEEVNIVERGGNYGWVIREGFHCFDPFNPRNPPADCSDVGPHGEPLIDPIVEYSHPGSGFDPEIGVTVIGGYVYRGHASTSLIGDYIFGDFTETFFPASGILLYIEEPAGDSPQIRRFQIGYDDRDYGLYLKGFGEDEAGEVYACGSSVLAPAGTGGICHRIVALN